MNDSLRDQLKKWAGTNTVDRESTEHKERQVVYRRSAQARIREQFIADLLDPDVDTVELLLSPEAMAVFGRAGKKERRDTLELIRQLDRSVYHTYKLIHDNESEKEDARKTANGGRRATKVHRVRRAKQR